VKAFSLLLLFFTSAFTGHGYSINRDSTSSEFAFDPLFWKKDLKLTEEQCFTIGMINSDFYASLQSEAIATNRFNLKFRLTALLQKRTELIRLVLTHRQKVKWKKIQFEYAERIFMVYRESDVRRYIAGIDCRTERLQPGFFER
jgi:hypothetical protein